MVSVKEFDIAARGGFSIPVRSYIPVSSSSDTKAEEGVGAADEAAERVVMIYLHAGGFLFGDLDSGEMNCRVLAKRLRISALGVGYRLAPEWKFPVRCRNMGMYNNPSSTPTPTPLQAVHLNMPPPLGCPTRPHPSRRQPTRRLHRRRHLLRREPRRRRRIHRPRRRPHTPHNCPLALHPRRHTPTRIPTSRPRAALSAPQPRAECREPALDRQVAGGHSGFTRVSGRGSESQFPAQREP